MTGYHASWCRVEVDGQEGYIKTDYLTMEDEIASKEDESSEEESENASERSIKRSESSMSEEHHLRLLKMNQKKLFRE